MALPSLSVPEFETKVPSSGTPIRFRPFLVKEEKLLFIALESKDQKETVRAVTNLLKSCILTEDVNVDKLASFDFEYLFLQLRSKSVGEIVDLKFGHMNEDDECKHKTEVKLNLQEITPPKVPDENSRNVMLTESIGIRLNYPSIHAVQMLAENIDDNDFEKIMKMIELCTQCIFDKEQVYDNFEPGELSKFIGDMSQTQFEEVAKFFADIPQLKHKIKWKCEKCGKDESIELVGLQNFFT
mgnify:FL=1